MPPNTSINSFPKSHISKYALIILINTKQRDVDINEEVERKKEKAFGS